MKALTIIEQVNACIKHANRNGLKIERFEVGEHWGKNHQVIANLPQSKEGGIPYFSVAVLINSKKEPVCNESTWN